MKGLKEQKDCKAHRPDLTFLPVNEGRSDEDRKFRRLVIQGWIIVCGIAVLFVLYGFFAYFAVGEKGPSNWDYGTVEDIPGESVYSTYPYRGRVPEPLPQHINQTPSAATEDATDKQGRIDTQKNPDEENQEP